MNYFLLPLYFLLIIFVLALPKVNAKTEMPAGVAIALHGGAGTISAKNMIPEKEKAYVDTLKRAAEIGYGKLLAGEAGENAVIAAIQYLEQSPLFNAGVGAVYTYDESHELDASIMLGVNKNAGAVAGVKHIESPILAAFKVMTLSPHVMLSGQGAEDFAKEIGLPLVDNRIFNTSHRYNALQKAKAKLSNNKQASHIEWREDSERYGTVGAVVIDVKGNLVAGTSTGGMTAKRYGRIGDSPVIGAGTYADNASCAVSATGHGEYFIRFNVAADICARVKYSKMSLNEAANVVIQEELLTAGGTGGVVAIDREGNIAMPFNTSGMYRAKIDSHGNLSVGIYKDYLLNERFIVDK